MELFELLAQVAGDLEREEIIYALTGSVASSLHGRPRASIDADIALRMTPQQTQRLVDRWRDRFYVSPESMRDAAVQNRVANLVETASGLKIDLSVLPPTEFYGSVLERRQRFKLPSGQDIWVVSPEDVILMKLLWRKDSRSRKQFDDALGVVQIMGQDLDWPYMRQWSQRLGLMTDLQQLRAEGLDL